MGPRVLIWGFLWALSIYQYGYMDPLGKVAVVVEALGLRDLQVSLTVFGCQELFEL